MSSLRVLFVACDSGGHVTSMVAFAKLLRDRGHEPFVLATEPERASVEGAGATLVSPEHPDRFGLGAILRRAFRESPSVAKRLPARLQKTPVETFIAKRERELVFRRELPGIVGGMAHEVSRAAREVDADVVVADSLSFGAAYGAKSVGRPYVSLGTDPAFSLDAWGRPFLLPHLSLRAVPPLIWRRVVDAALPLKRLRRSLGLPPQNFTAELYATCLSDELHLVVAPPGFNGVASAPSHVFIGPLTYGAANGNDSDVANGITSSTVLVTGSTTGHPRGVAALRRTVEALARTSLDVVVAAGRLDGYAPDVPPNVRLIDGFAPHDTMIPRAGVVVTHGGWGVVGRALRGGTPLVVTPAFGPQDFVGDRVGKMALGVELACDEISTETIERACSHAMRDAGIRASVTAMAKQLAMLDTGALATTEIERLVASRRQASG